MSKKRRRAPPPPSPLARVHGSAKTAERFPPDGGRRPTLTSGRRFLLRLLCAVVVPLIVLASAEGVLRLAGYGHPTRFFLPIEAVSGDTAVFGTNRRFGWIYQSRETATQPQPVMLSAVKPAGTRRVFVLGESAAHGTPAPAFGFTRILGVLLEHQYPSNRVEIVNAAMRGINSHALVSIARDCARHSPDVFLLYMGNNERVGQYAPEPGRPHLTPYRRLLRLRERLLQLRLSQAFAALVQAMTGAAAGSREQTMDFFRAKRLAADNPRWKAVEDNFCANLQDIGRIAAKAGAQIVVSTIAVNRRDFPPLASLHRGGLTAADRSAWEVAFQRGAQAEEAGQWAEVAARFGEAGALDSHHAELQFRWARARLFEGQIPEAREHFALACDWDALQFRTDRRLNALVRDMAAGLPGWRMLNAEQTFAESPAAEHGIPGARLFHDHVHFTFEGDYLLARSFAPLVAEALGWGPPEREMPTLPACAEVLAYTEWDAISVRSAFLRMTARPPFQDQLDHQRRQQTAEKAVEQDLRRFQDSGGIQRVVAAYRLAVTRWPDDWQIRANFGNALADFGQHAAAAEELTAAVRFMPVAPHLRVSLAQALWKSRQSEAAIAQLEECLRRDPDYQPARDGLVELKRQAGP